MVSFAWIFFRMPTLEDATDMILKIFSDFGCFSIAPLDSISIVGIGCGLPLLVAKEIREEFMPNRIKFLNNHIIKWIFYVIVACYILTMGVLDAGQFIYVSF